MSLSTVAANAAFAAGRALLTAALPVQDWVSPCRATHSFINRHALAILRADGRGRVAELLEPVAGELDRGSDWADTGWKNVSHMYNPRTGRGLWGWPAATEVCTDYFNQAVREWRQGAARRAAFWLGAACHLVQDLCVPHHASALVLEGHSAFEELGERVREKYPVYGEGDYDVAAAPDGWVRANAEIANAYLAISTARAGTGRMERAIGELLPLAQRTTAGFIAFFFRTVGEVG